MGKVQRIDRRDSDWPLVPRRNSGSARLGERRSSHVQASPAPKPAGSPNAWKQVEAMPAGCNAAGANIRLAEAAFAALTLGTVAMVWWGGF